MQPLLSLIIPVYNRANTIAACLQSVLDYQEGAYELILLDDGSTDESVSILHRFQAQYPNTIRFYQNSKNLGPGPTRNKGIALARGKFLFFLDSDDLVHTALLPEVFRVLAEYPETDIFAFQHFTKHPDGTKWEVRSFDAEGPFSANVFLAKSPGIFTNALWKFIFQRKRILNNRILLPNTRFAEDFAFVSQAFLSAHTVYACPFAFYTYCIASQDSLGQSATIQRKEEGFCACIAGIEQHLQAHAASPEKANAVNFAVYTMYMLQLPAYTDIWLSETAFPKEPKPVPSTERLGLSFYRRYGIGPSGIAAVWNLLIFHLRQAALRGKTRFFFAPASSISICIAKALTAYFAEHKELHAVSIGFLDNNCESGSPFIKNLESAGFSAAPFSRLADAPFKDSSYVCVLHWAEASYQISRQLCRLGCKSGVDFLCLLALPDRL